MIFLLLTLAASQPGTTMDESWTITDLSFLTRHTNNMVAVKPDGEVFILNRQGPKVLHYGADGKLIKVVGGRGRGPGKYERPISLSFLGDRLYLQEFRKVNVYDADGHFVKKVKAPTTGELLT